jgi:hypothetical protein
MSLYTPKWSAFRAVHKPLNYRPYSNEGILTITEWGAYIHNVPFIDCGVYYGTPYLVRIFL